MTHSIRLTSFAVVVLSSLILGELKKSSRNACLPVLVDHFAVELLC